MWYCLFLNNSNEYIVVSDPQLAMDGRWILEEDEYELIYDSFRSIAEAEEYARNFYGAHRLKLQVVPINLKKRKSS